MNTSPEIDQKLPVLISVPHGGDQIPPELDGKVALTQNEIFEDGDALTREIYNFKHEVIAYLDTPIARAFVDLNRGTHKRPPQYPDGVVKTETVNKIPVYKPGQYPNESLIETLLKNYYFPYHDVLDALQTNKNIMLALDCHSMLAKSPPISPNPDQERPLICLSNRGDKKGYPMKQGASVTCPPEFIQLLAKCFQKIFTKDGKIKINEPFSGGYIIQSHSKGNIPWIQVEINRKLYLSPPYFNPETLTVSEQRIFELRNKILTVIKMFCNIIKKKK
ncbi:MAG: N-formylglutamate amidohydrolase [bacterium]|nr:MAG: N-formylglutamate amidohydrolase [bacterium]